jgi:transposase
VEARQELDHEPGSGVCAQKKRRDTLIALAARHSEWVVGFEDEVWWSRLAQPHLRTWGESALQLVAKARPKGDTAPKALACYGLLRADTGQMLLRFVDGRPVSAVTSEFLRWICGRLAKARKRVFVLVWDNAAWHVSAAVRSWIRKHNRAVKGTGKGVRILECRLPLKSPWLNPIEPKWVHGKRAIVEPTRTLTPDEVESHVSSYYGCSRTKHLQQPVP